MSKNKGNDKFSTLIVPKPSSHQTVTVLAESNDANKSKIYLSFFTSAEYR